MWENNEAYSKISQKPAMRSKNEKKCHMRQMRTKIIFIKHQSSMNYEQT